MFAALFFVTIGMLINISQFDDFILPAIIVAVMFILGKIIANAVAAFTAGYSGRTAVHVGMGMPQMGEFSLAIAKTGADSGVVTTPLYPIIASATAITSFTTPYISRSAERVANFIDRRSPKLLRAYLASLADWLGTLRAIFSRDSSSARKVQHSFKVIVVNLLIVIVLISTGTFTLQYIDSLSRWSHFGREVVALMVGATILFLCFPCIVVIWRSLHDIVNEATIYMISKRKSAKPWRQEALRHVLTDSMLIVLTVFLFVSFIPFMAGLFDVGHRAIVIPLLLVALALYFVSTSVWHIHSRVESTFSRTLIGDELVSSDEASRILGVTVRTVEQMARERRLPGTKEGKQWRISKAALEAMAIGDSSSGDMSINEDEAQ
jgi:CPA2 family monovalent cation:H+ antiporter-2